MNSDPLLTMVVGGIVAAFALGFIAHKLRISPIVGYLLAGVLIGPYTPGFIADGDLAGELAELGVILIMFGVGLKFSPAKLIEYRWIALPCALGQIALVTALGFGIAALFGMSWIEGMIFGFSMAIASTIVLLRTLEDRHESASPAGHLAISWLIVQDITAVFVLVVMSTLAQNGATGPADGETIARVVGIKAAELGIFALIMTIIGRRVLPGLLVVIARAKSRELFSLAVFSIALGIAYAAHAVFGASFALGAFAAGLVLNETAISHRAAEDLIPLRDAFAVLFFVSVGMLFDPEILLTQRWAILAVLGVIILGNGGAAFLLTTVMRVPLPDRVILAGGLAQIGEFSFLISGTALSLELMSQDTHALISAGAVLAIALNPVIREAARFLAQRSAGAAEADLADPA